MMTHPTHLTKAVNGIDEDAKTQTEMMVEMMMDTVMTQLEDQEDEATEKNQTKIGSLIADYSSHPSLMMGQTWPISNHGSRC